MAGDALELPGAELVERGVADLRAGWVTVESALVSRAATRLRTSGLDLPQPTVADPEARLYRLLAAAHGDGAHGVYNALSRRLVSYVRAREHALGG